MSDNKTVADGFIEYEGDIYVSLSMLENFASGMLGSLKTPHMLSASVKTMCEEMYIKAGLRESEEATEDGKNDGNSSNA